MPLHPLPQLAKSDLDRLRRFRVLPNLKIPLFVAMMAAFTLLAWHTDSWVLRWSSYIAVGYLWMSMVTFMHDATHFTLFRTRILNWVYGILCLLPIFATFVAFRHDHIEHHRHNRSFRDPDAFTMGRRRVVDFVVFYAYALIGGVLTFLHFNFIYPFTSFGPRQWAVQIFELALKGVVYWLVLDFAADNGVLGKTLEVWLWPVFFLSLINSMRFLSEHYGTHWGEGPLRGTRTVISNPVNAFFWNNINFHTGHHVYPSVPWYNLRELHQILEPQILASGAVVDRSYFAVYWQALRRGPESVPRVTAFLAEREARKAHAPAAAMVADAG
jgi:fatty acid desaturase